MCAGACIEMLLWVYIKKLGESNCISWLLLKRTGGLVGEKCGMENGLALLNPFICIVFELFHSKQTVMQHICYENNE